MYPKPPGFQSGLNAVECMYTGFRYMSNEVMRDYNGVLVSKSHADYRHPQEFAPITAERDVPRETSPRKNTNFIELTVIDDP